MKKIFYGFITGFLILCSLSQVKADPPTHVPSCVFGYNIKNNQVYFCDGETEFLVQGFDASSFQSIDDLYYAKDNQAVYCNGQKMDADPATFQLITKPGLINYYQDANSVYFVCGQLPGSDPETFENIKGSFNRDKNNVYFQGIVLDADRNTFVGLGNGYGKDNTKVFFTHYEVYAADVNTFEVKAPGDYSIWCGSADAKDKHAFYLVGQQVCSVSQNSLNVLSELNGLLKGHTSLHLLIRARALM